MIDWDSDPSGQEPKVTASQPTSAPTPPAVSVPTSPGTEAYKPPTDAFDLLGRMLRGEVTAPESTAFKSITDATGTFLQNTMTPIGGYKAAETIASRVPMAWLPGGADAEFEYIGEVTQKTDPETYLEWLKVKAAAEADVLGGGNLKADFNLETSIRYDEMNRSSVLGTNPRLMLGRGAIGSLGGAISNALQGWLGLPSQLVNKGAAATGFLGQGTDRLQRIVDAYNDDPDQLTNPAERRVGEMLSTGQWDEVHAVDYLIREGAGYSENPWVNLGATAVLDPTTWTPAVAGQVAKVGVKGEQIINAGAKATSNFERLQVMVAEQRTGLTGDIWKHARATVGMDPLGAYAPKPQSASASAVLDIQAAQAVDVYRRAYNPVMVTRVQQEARSLGIGERVDQAIAQSAVYQTESHIAWDATQTALLEEARIAGTPDEYVELAMRMQQESQVDRAVEFVTGNKVVPHTPAQLDDLAARVATMAGISKDDAARRVAGWSEDQRSAWYDVTFSDAYRDFELAKQNIDVEVAQKASQTGELPIGRMVLMNENSLDDIAKEALISDIKQYLDDGDILTANFIWDGAVARYPVLGGYGSAPGGEAQLRGLIEHVERYVEPMRTATPEELAAMPAITDMLGRHTNDGRELYRVGFRPSEEVGWGLRENPISGRLMATRQPLISRKVDPLIMPQKFYDPIRNSMGQIIGKRAADRLTRPVESMGAMFEAAKDNISGRRVYMNWQAAFRRGMEEKGVNKAIADDVFKRIAEITQARETTIRGANPQDMAKVLQEIAAEGKMVTPAGNTLNEMDLLDILLTASKGDFRIVGLGTGLTQRMRNMIRAAGMDANNRVGELTVTQYLNFRYRLNPTFGSQRALEGPYYAVTHGVRPVGRTLPPELKGMELMLRNLGNTTIGRDFALDVAEYNVRVNFGLELADRLAKLKGGRTQRFRNWLERVGATADPYVRNNMIAMGHSRMGALAKELLADQLALSRNVDDIAGASREIDTITRTWQEIAKHQSERAGRVLTDDEVGLAYIQDMFASSLRMRATENGIDIRGIVGEMHWMGPSSIGEIGTLYPENVAIDLGYNNLDELRTAVTPRYSPKTGRHINTQDMMGLAAKMRAANYHPDVIRRLTGLDEANKMVHPNAYFANTWQGFWDDMARPTAEGGMDLSAHSTEGARDVIRAMAKARGMEPWEYLSAVVGHNVQGNDLKTVMGEFARFLQGNPKSAPLREWIRHFNSIALQESGARALLDEYTKALPKLIEETMKTDPAKAQELNRILGYLKGGTEESGGAVSATGTGQAATGIEAKLAAAEAVFKPGSEIGFTGRPETMPGEDLLKAVDDAVRAEPEGFAYHVTTSEALSSIRKQGLLPKNPRNGDVEGVYFGQSADALREYVPQNNLGDNVLLRANTSRLDPSGENFDELVSRDTIYPDEIEFLGSDGQWHPLIDGLPSLKPYRPVPSKNFELDWGDEAPIPERPKRVPPDIAAMTAAARASMVEEGQALNKAARPVNAVPEGFTDNPNVAASGQTFPPDVRREGLFHVTTGRDSVMAEGFRGHGETGGQGFGSASDVAGQGRVSFLTDRARAQTYMDRMKLAVRAARGEATKDEILDVFRPLYEKAFPGEADKIMSNAVGSVVFEKGGDAKVLYGMVRHLDGALTGGRLTSAEKSVVLTAPFEDVKKIDPDQIAILNLATRERAEVQKGIDLAELTIKPEDVRPLSYEGQAAAREAADKQAFKDIVGEEYDKWFEGEIVKRIKSGKPHSNPNVEAIARGLSDWTKTAVTAAKVQGTRSILKDLVEKVPKEGAATWNRSEALVHQVARTKLQDVERDVFRLAEMQTERTAFGRSVNHPIFGFYPASYMWGKVFPETIKFLTRSPYGITYDILKVQMLIAAQRDMSPDFEATMNDVDRSTAAFLLGYLTPSLPWEEQQIRLSPLFREVEENLRNGTPNEIPGDIARDFWDMIGVDRWTQDTAEAVQDVGKLVQDTITPDQQQQLQSLPPSDGSNEPGPAPQAKGPIQGTELEPVLVDSMTELQDALR